MKRIILSIALVILAQISFGDATPEEQKRNYKLVTGESMAIIMTYMDELLLETCEERFRNEIKGFQDSSAEQVAAGSNATVKITFTQKTNIKNIVNDMYYSEIRPLLRSKYSKMTGKELDLIATLIESDEENPKALALNNEVMNEFIPEAVEKVHQQALMFCIGCTMINDIPKK